MTAVPHYQVTCHTPDNTDPDRRLQGLGGPADGGWWRDIDYLIAGIEAREYDLWTTTRDRKSVWVYVVQGRYRKYLTTDPDGRLPNNLLELPVCP